MINSELHVHSELEEIDDATFRIKINSITAERLKMLLRTHRLSVAGMKSQLFKKALDEIGFDEVSKHTSN